MDDPRFDQQLGVIDTQLNILKFQVLNTLDEMMKQKEMPDPKTLDLLVKGPFMRAVTAIERAKTSLVSLKKNLK